MTTNSMPKSTVRGGVRRNGPKPKPKPKPKSATAGRAAPTGRLIGGPTSSFRVFSSAPVPEDLLNGNLGVDLEEVTRAMFEEMRLVREGANGESPEAFAAAMDVAAAAAEGASTGESVANDKASADTDETKDQSVDLAQEETFWKCESFSAEDISPESIALGTTTDPVTGLRRTAISGAELILKHDQGLPVAYCPPEKVGLVISYARSVIGNAIIYHHWTDESSIPAEPAQAWEDQVDGRMRDRAAAIFEAHGPMCNHYASQEEVVASVRSYAALSCAQEYVNASGRFFRANLLEIATLSAEKCWKASAEEKAWLVEFVDAWIQEHPYQLPAAAKQAESRGQDDGTKKDNRLFDLIEHFRKGRRWPRTLHGNRVMPFGAPDLLDKVRFEEGESKRACLSCRKEFDTSRGWREHLLVSAEEHEVYLCCGRQFVALEGVIEHLAVEHKGKLGMLEPFILRKHPCMDMWE